MEWLDFLQWPAMAVTVAATSLVAQRKRGRRELGFWLFLLSNLLWVTWGWQAKAWALVGLQFCLCALNVYGVRKNETG